MPLIKGMLLFGSGRLLSVQVSAGDADAECWSLADRGNADAILPQSVHKYDPVDVEDGDGDGDETDDMLPTAGGHVSMPQPEPFYGAPISGGRDSCMSEGGPELPPPELLAARLHDTSPLLYTSSLAALEAKARENVRRAKAEEYQRAQVQAQAEAEAAAVTAFLASKQATPRGSGSNTLSRTAQSLKGTVLWDGTRAAAGNHPSTTAATGTLPASGTNAVNRAGLAGPTWIGSGSGLGAGLGTLPTYPTPSTLASPPSLVTANPIGSVARNGTDIIDEELNNTVPPNLSFVLYARGPAPEGGEPTAPQTSVDPVGESIVGGKESTTVIYGTNGNNGLENVGPDPSSSPKRLAGGNVESALSQNVHYYRAFKNPPFKYA